MSTYNKITNSPIGKWAKLIETPDGCTSKLYDVVVGKKYKIFDCEGSNLWVKTPSGTASIWRGRFVVFN